MSFSLPLAATELAVQFGLDRVAFSPGVPVLAGSATEGFVAGACSGVIDGFTVFQAGDWLLGHAALPAGEALERNTRQLYLQLLRIAAGGQLARVWNYVPRINGNRSDGLENYRAFCSGRAAAFHEAWGDNYKRRVPAASAVGSQGDQVSVVFAATTRAVRHVENPRQVPAYDYPSEHGPQAPSFARATVVGGLGTNCDVFVSGTAAIRGHVTQTPRDTARQLSCTFDNLRVISSRCGLGDDLAAGAAAARHFKIYVRNPADLALARSGFEAEFMRPDDRITYLHADICRVDLNVEIEASIIGASQ